MEKFYENVEGGKGLFDKAKEMYNNNPEAAKKMASDLMPLVMTKAKQSNDPRVKQLLDIVNKNVAGGTNHSENAWTLLKWMAWILLTLFLLNTSIMVLVPLMAYYSMEV